MTLGSSGESDGVEGHVVPHHIIGIVGGVGLAGDGVDEKAARVGPAAVKLRHVYKIYGLKK